MVDPFDVRVGHYGTEACEITREKPEKRERGLKDDRASCHDCSCNSNRADGVREDVPQDDPEVACTDRAGGCDIFLPSQFQGRGAHDPRERHPQQACEQE